MMHNEASLMEYIVNNLDNALAKGWISVVYQPIIRSISGQICEMEALARWNDPEKGEIPPSVFVPALAEADRVEALDSFVLRLVCQEYQKRIEDELPVVPCSVNISQKSFLKGGLFQHAEDMVSECKLSRKLIHIEVTEEEFLTADKDLAYEISRFQYAGYQVWMDDFGCGGTPLGEVFQRRIEAMKMDGSLLTGFQKQNQIVVKSIVRAAKELGVETIAEAVETQEEAAFLRDIGCEKLQGFYFCKPMGYQEAVDFCHDNSIGMENESSCKYYQQAGRVDFTTDTPMALIGDDGRRFYVIYSNPLFQRVIAELSKEENFDLVAVLNNPKKLLGRSIRKLLSKAIASGREESMVYQDTYGYGKLTLQPVVLQSGILMHKVSVENITATKNAVERSSQMAKNEKLATDAMRMALRYSQPEDSIRALIERIGSSAQVSRAYVQRFGTAQRPALGFGWDAEAGAVGMDRLPNFHLMEGYDRWVAEFGTKHLLVITDVNTSSYLSEPMRQSLQERGVTNMIIVPVLDGAERIGYYGLENPSAELYDTSPTVMESLGHFLTMQIRLWDALH